jgi:ATP-binding cassette subfamily C (CFTR/MRP) protein 1
MLPLMLPSLQNATVGEIVNYMQLDAGRVENMASYLHPLWDSVLQIAGYSVLLYRVLGPSAVLGMAIMASLIPTNTFIFRRLSAYRMEMLEHTDHRVRVVNEMLQGIRAIKFYHWESAFRTRVESIHEEELGILQRSAQLRSFLVSLLTTAPTLVIVATLTAYSLMGNTLHPSTVFAALALFNQLRFPLYFLPVTLSSLAEGKPSIDRLSNFFAAEEVVPYVQRANHAPRDYPEDVAASISAGAFTWVAPPLAGHVSQPQTPLLHGIELEVKKGELVAIIGEVGSGKSSVLSALLGEMRHVFGTIYTQGSLAFVPQSPWIPNDTVRGNILFGSKYDAEKYAKVVETCGLTRDLGLLEFGDETEIGEQGINLSGGQKQRLSIARALYKSADLFLLDDPLSALDAQVAQDVFEKCVQGAMAERGATRVLVTNQLQFLPRVDRVIMMGRLPGVDGSTIVDQGTYEELISRGHDLKAAVGAHDEEEDVAIADGHAPSAVAMPSLSHLEEELVEAVVLPSVDPSSPVEEPSPPSDAPPPSPIKKGRGRAGGGLMSDEDRATGAVARSVYTSYLSSAAKPMVLGMLGCLFLVSNTAVQLQQWVVSFWTSDPGYVLHPLRFYLAGVTGTAAVVASLTHLRTVFAYTLGIRAARRMHRTMLQRVLHAPVSFFDSTPVGRIVQRFSKDTDSIDQSLVGQLIMLINAIMGMVGSLGAIMVATPPFALVVGPLAAIYIRMMNYFRPVARELQRLDSITRSPVYAHFGETLGGLTAIRAFGHTPRFARTNEMLLNANLAAYLTKKAADRWLNVRLELMGNVVVLMSGLLCVQIARGGRFVPGLAGLAITNALSVTGLLNWVVRCYSETEAMMTGVERVLYTSRETVQEAPHAVNCHKKSSRMGIGDELSGTAGSTVADHTECPDDDMLLQTGWPWEGAIEFRGVNMRYRSDVGLALKDVDLAIRPGEKVGIVGRTGSGKSSLNKVLFRIVEPETGTILLDGVDCGRVGLGALRSRLTIIPQDPVLFSGTLRTNLDPFGDHSDEEIWDALDAAKLGAIARALQGGLSHPIAEYGENFSVGQRQLICLARALLRRTRVLLLDEATSSIDYSTDKTIQEAISVAFENCTVLTVAHRLETIRNSDRVLVMDDGKVVEFAPPDELASNPNSRFAQLLAAENNQKSNNNGNNRAPATHANGASVLTPAASGGAAVA